MKILKQLIPVALLVSGAAMAGESMIEVSVPVDHVFAPAGFDSNDHAEVVISGYLPNLCYKAPKADVKVVGNKIQINMKANKIKRGLGLCPTVIVPFIENVNIGLLDQGKYDLAVNENSPYEKNANMKVVEASSNSIDENIYANVSEIVRVSEQSRRVQLKGYNPSDCFELKEVQVVDNGSDVYSVLPKLNQLRDHCPKKMVPFVYEFSVPESLAAPQVLLHVRVMDGKSMNALFNNLPLVVE